MLVNSRRNLVNLSLEAKRLLSQMFTDCEQDLKKLKWFYQFEMLEKLFIHFFFFLCNVKAGT